MASLKTPLLADALAGVLSPNAARHLRDARVARVADRFTSAESLRVSLLLRRFDTPAALLDLEQRAGGAAFPRWRLLGASCFLDACPTLQPKDMPRLDGEAVFPVFGVLEHLEEWQSPFLMMGPSGALSVFDAPHGPAPAYASLEHFLEVEALAPLGDAAHVLRVDALCGEMLAGLVGAEPHPPAMGAHTAGYVGDEVWVKELRIALGGEAWSSFHGTFLLSERVDLIVDATGLLLEEGFSLGHKGPTAAPPPGVPQVLSFVDAYPELGRRARVEVTVWGAPGSYCISRGEGQR